MLKNFSFCARWRKILAIFFAPPGAPGGAKIEIFEVLEITKKQKKIFNKRFTWNSDQEEF